jgi:hypothetical protein
MQREGGLGPPSRHSGAASLGQMRARKLAAAVLIALGLAGCTHSEQEAKTRSPAEASSGEARLESGGTVGALWVAGDRVHGLSGRRRGQKLAAPVSTTLIGTLSPAAVSDPSGGDLLVYNAWRGNRPVLRLHDLGNGRDSLLDEGALSLAWRRDGTLAYFKALEPKVRDARRYLGHVVVRSSQQARPVPWTRQPGRYVVAAWARKRLLVYRIGRGWPDLLVLDGPGRARVLARAGALVAIRPDGRQAFVATYGTSPPVVRVLDVGTGSAAARSTLRRTNMRWLSESGSWSGEHVVAATSRGLAVFRVGGAGIRLAQVVRFPRGTFTTGVLEPRLGPSGDRIVGWGELESRPREPLPRAVVLECDRVQLRCVSEPPISSAIGPRLVYNPSRPAPVR